MTTYQEANILKGKVPKIMLCGDSVFAGIIFDNEQGRYLKSKNNTLSKIVSYLSADIKSLCSFGNTTLRMKRSFIKKLNVQNPDIVVFELGGNDCDYDWRSIAKAPYDEHDPNIKYERYIEELTEMVQIVKDKGMIPVISTLPPLDADRFLKWVSQNDEKSEEEIQKWLGSATHIYWWQEKYSNGALEVAREHDCRILDIRGAFLKEDDYRKFLCIDGMHPNDKGQQLMADRVKAYIKRTAPWLLAK